MKGPMMPCKTQSIGKARPLVVNKHVDNHKKATRASERIFSDSATIKAPQDSGMTITNRNWHIIVDQYDGYKELDSTVPRVTLWNKEGKNGKVTWQ